LCCFPWFMLRNLVMFHGLLQGWSDRHGGSSRYPGHNFFDTTGCRANINMLCLDLVCSTRLLCLLNVAYMEFCLLAMEWQKQIGLVQFDVSRN
jgi:hypothetical protein